MLGYQPGVDVTFLNTSVATNNDGNRPKLSTTVVSCDTLAIRFPVTRHPVLTVQYIPIIQQAKTHLFPSRQNKTGRVFQLGENLFFLLPFISFPLSCRVLLCRGQQIPIPREEESIIRYNVYHNPAGRGGSTSTTDVFFPRRGVQVIQQGRSTRYAPFFHTNNNKYGAVQNALTLLFGHTAASMIEIQSMGKFNSPQCLFFSIPPFSPQKGRKSTFLFMP